MTYPYQALYALARELHQSNLNAHQILEAALQHTLQMIGASQAGIVLFHDESTIQDAQIVGNKVSGEALWQMLLTKGLVGYVYYDQRTVVIHDISTDARWPKLSQAPQLPRIGSAVGLPLPRGKNICGVLLLIHPQVEFFTPDKITLLQEISALISEALNNSLDYRGGNDVDRRYYTLFDNAVVPIILTNREGRIIDINRQATALFGYLPNDLVNRTITDIHPLDLKTLCNGQGLDSLELDAETTVQTVLRTQTGTKLPVLVRLRHIMVEDYEVIEWIQQDVSAQMALEQLRRDLTAMVYHDLRGPLQNLNGSIQKLSQVLANHEDPAIWTLLQVGLRSSRQLRRMVDSLLDVQRLEEGSRILDKAEYDIRMLLAHAAELVQPLAIEAGLRLKFDLPNDLPKVLVDGDMLTRVVVNLLENAVKYTPSSGTVTLLAYNDPDKITVRVRDNGPGIPAEMLDKVFDKFNRVNYTKAPKGIGLGLAFCRLAIDAHGGTIWVESELGHGSDFVFTLPQEQKPDTRKTDRGNHLATTA
jgi:NtrC-family two-component system sensor histidine kinase KinB